MLNGRDRQGFRMRCPRTALLTTLRRWRRFTSTQAGILHSVISDANSSRSPNPDPWESACRTLLENAHVDSVLAYQFPEGAAILVCRFRCPGDVAAICNQQALDV